MTLGEVCINLVAKETYTPNDYYEFFSGKGIPKYYGFKQIEGAYSWERQFKTDSKQFKPYQLSESMHEDMMEHRPYMLESIKREE